MRLFLLICLVLFSACTSTPYNSVKDSTADQALSRLMDRYWGFVMESNPTWATSMGIRDYDDRLEDYSLETYEKQLDWMKEFESELLTINVSQLTDDNQLNHELLALQLKNNIEGANYGGKYQLMTNRGAPHLSLAQMPSRLPFRQSIDYQSYLKRLALVPEQSTQVIDRLRKGLEAGWKQPCESMRGFENSITTHIVSDLEQSNFMQPFKKRPNAVSKSEFNQYKKTAEDLIKNKVIPAYSEFANFYNSEYAPACNTVDGVSSLPGGEAFYAYKVRQFTTTDRTPEEVHQIGLSEVKRIRAEMDEVISEAGFEGSFKDWQEHLRTNPDFYPKTADERMNAVAVIMKKMDGLLPELFTRFPRMPYGLKEIPLDIAEKTTTAYYNQPAGDGSRAGFYFVNTTKLDTRPLHELEALSLHEAVPGHHFQIALAQELDLPEFRRHGGFTAFVEGWGLYAERLGLEVGFYQTPYTNFGRLSYEMWRACRLVVDTGIHAKGWTRQQAIDFMAENSGLSLNNITTEVDRYITWPGQALAYKTGEMKIRELRARAESALGASFDVRKFHDTVLENGAIPLSVLEKKIEAWIKTGGE